MINRYCTFAIIGTGIVGTSLAVLLEKAGLQCIGVNTRSQASYDRFCRYLAKDHLPLDVLARQADLIFITTQDGAIEKVAQDLSSCKERKVGQLWIHCSGSLPSAAMCRNPDLKIGYLSIHPLQAFATVENALTLMPGTHYGVEGNNRVTEEVGELVVRTLGGIPHRIDPAKKTLYHAGAVIASNYLVALSYLAVKLFDLAGINQKEALESLLPLIGGSYQNISRVGLPDALTGPIARGDTEVVMKHLKEIPVEFLDTYKGLGRLALELSHQKGANQGKPFDTEKYLELKQQLAK